MPNLDDLNPRQREAATTVDGPLLVLAGAGSGKTRVLTYRIAHLIRHLDVPPWHILSVTFTNKAAGEMRSRIEQLVGGQAERVWLGTFHSVCARILRYEAVPFGLHPNFTIYDEDDRRSLMRRVMDQAGISEQDLTARTALGEISRAKNAMIDCDRFEQEAVGNPRRTQIAQLYRAYDQSLRANHALDFDDLIVEPVRQFNQNPEVLERYQDRFSYILIDEYQDTNRPQYLLARQLSEKHRNICCVGDDDQSIYQFRGADVRNILDFESDYPEALTVRLEQNYRSTGRILAAANAVIENNRGRKGKNLWTDIGEGDLIQLAECGSDRSEARHVVSTVADLCRREGLGLGEAAILYRTNAQSRPLEEELQRAGLPYTIIGSIRFYERKEIKDLLGYLRVLVNEADEVSLRRIINTPKRGIGDTTVDRLQDYAAGHSISLLSALNHIDQIPELNSRSRKSLSAFHELWMTLTSAARERGSLPELAQEILERSGYMEHLLSDSSPESETRQENLGQLIGRMTEFDETREDASLDLFLEEVALMTPQDDAGEDRQSLTLMTLHMAKGLEYPVVAVCGLEEQIFPTARAIEESRLDDDAIEEERRLLYVGVTRAQRHLILSYARSRFVFGSIQESVPSRFVAEFPTHLLDHYIEPQATVKTELQSRLNRRRDRMPGPVKRQPTPASTPEGVHYEWEGGNSGAVAHLETLPEALDVDDDMLAVGRWILHDIFGRGQITGRAGSGIRTKLTVRFANGRHRKIVVAYANLQPG